VSIVCQLEKNNKEKENSWNWRVRSNFKRKEPKRKLVHMPLKRKEPDGSKYKICKKCMFAIFVFYAPSMPGYKFSIPHNIVEFVGCLVWQGIPGLPAQCAC